MTVDDKLLDEARSARHAYYGVRGAQAGPLSNQPPDLESDPHRRDFVALARMCMESGVKTSDFVLVASDFYIGQDRKPELPRDFLNAALVERYSSLGHGINPAPPEERWNMQETRLKTVARNFGADFDVFNWLLVVNGLEAWFRVAWPYGTAKLMRFHGQTAYTEMSNDPRITRLLRKLRGTVVEELEETFGKLRGEHDDSL